MRSLSLYFLLCFLFVIARSQDSSFSFGARNAGIAGASITLGDAYSLFNNVGGLGKMQDHAVFAGYQNQYNITEFQVIGGGGIFHHHLGNAGIGYYKFGDELFSQQKLHLAIGNKIQMVSLGLGIDWVQYDIESVGTQQVLAVQFGGIAEINSRLLFGAHIFNINQATLVSETGEQLPTIMKGGVSYRPTNELMINVEVEKDLDFDEIFKAGIEYRVVEDVFIRTGISTQPFVGAFGIGFHPKKLEFDYAFLNDAELGNTHEFSLAFIFKK